MGVTADLSAWRTKGALVAAIVILLVATVVSQDDAAPAQRQDDKTSLTANSSRSRSETFGAQGSSTFLVTFDSTVRSLRRWSQHDLADDFFTRHPQLKPCWEARARKNAASRHPTDFLVLGWRTKLHAGVESPPGWSPGQTQGEVDEDDLGVVDNNSNDEINDERRRQTRLRPTWASCVRLLDKVASNDVSIVRVVPDRSVHHTLAYAPTAAEVTGCATKTTEQREREVERCNDYEGELRGTGRQLLGIGALDVVAATQAAELSQAGFDGRGTRVAVMDSGLEADHPWIKAADRTDWTGEEVLDDLLGHGTFVASVVAGAAESGCGGVAPGAAIYSMRVFDKRQRSYTSWFLDAFNYALEARVDVINLSVGGPDRADTPFVDKVREVVAAGIVVVTANGNNGPLYGTVTNPADQIEAIGVGGVGEGQRVAAFSARGMTTWELPSGYGQFKPDLLAWSRHLAGARVGGRGCTAMSGTSVASPIVAGAAAVLIGAMREGIDQVEESLAKIRRATDKTYVQDSKEEEASSANEGEQSQRRKDRRRTIIHGWGKDDLRSAVGVGSVKQLLLGTARRLSGAHVYEQGAGVLDLGGAINALPTHLPRVVFFPRELLLSECPLFWPHCTQPIYHSMMPLVVNVSLISSHPDGKVRVVRPPRFVPRNGLARYLHVGLEGLEVATEADEKKGDVHLPVSLGSSGFGSLALVLRVNAAGATLSGQARGEVVVGFETASGIADEARLLVSVSIQPTPPRHKRVLFSHYHSLGYPHANSPRDTLEDTSELLDGHGDHLHTNFHHAYMHLRRTGLFVEGLGGGGLSCIDASLYGAVVLPDAERSLEPDEIAKVQRDVAELGLGLVVLAEWQSSHLQAEVARFFDENTKDMWEPSVGGANVTSLNQLLGRWGVRLDEANAWSGDLDIGERQQGGGGQGMGGAATRPRISAWIRSGSAIVDFPTSKGEIFYASMRRVEAKVENGVRPATWMSEKRGALGLLEQGAGRVAIFVDTACLDDAHGNNDYCFDLLDFMLDFAIGKATAMDSDAKSSHEERSDGIESGRNVSAPAIPTGVWYGRNKVVETPSTRIPSNTVCGNWYNDVGRASGREVAIAAAARWTPKLEQQSRFVGDDPSHVDRHRPIGERGGYYEGRRRWNKKAWAWAIGLVVALMIACAFFFWDDDGSRGDLEDIVRGVGNTKNRKRRRKAMKEAL